MKETQMIEEALNAWGIEIISINETETKNWYSCDIDGFINLDEFLAEQHTLIGCSEKSVELVGFCDDKTIIKVEDYK